eukprot:Selendium_serpulae@DN6367_c0_g1_i1.p1
MNSKDKAVNPTVKDQFYRIKLCPYHMQGLCKKGKRCSFAHSHDELRVGITLRKTKLCEGWKRGHCNNPNCTFAHGEAELQSTPDYYKTALCRFWLKGNCPQGNLCRHAHGEHELRGRTYRHTNNEKVAHAKDTRQEGQSGNILPPQGNAVPSTLSSHSSIPPPPGFAEPEKLIEVYDGMLGARILIAPGSAPAPRPITSTPTTTAPSSPLLFPTQDYSNSLKEDASSETQSSVNIASYCDSWHAEYEPRVPNFPDAEVFPLGMFPMNTLNSVLHPDLLNQRAELPEHLLMPDSTDFPAPSLPLPLSAFADSNLLSSSCLDPNAAASLLGDSLVALENTPYWATLLDAVESFNASINALH